MIPYIRFNVAPRQILFNILYVDRKRDHASNLHAQLVCFESSSSWHATPLWTRTETHFRLSKRMQIKRARLS